MGRIDEIINRLRYCQNNAAIITDDELMSVADDAVIAIEELSMKLRGTSVYRADKGDFMKNGDAIRAMTDEELAEWFGKIQYDTAYFCAGEDKQKYPYPVGWLDWLRQEVKEDE